MEGVIDDDGDSSSSSSSSSSSKQIIDLKVSKTEVEKEKGKEKEKKVFWDKESNERAAKEINEEDSYRWEDEVRNENRLEKEIGLILCREETRTREEKVNIIKQEIKFDQIACTHLFVFTNNLKFVHGFRMYAIT